MVLLHFCSIHSAGSHVLVLSPFIPMINCNQNKSEYQLFLSFLSFNPGAPFLQQRQQATPAKSLAAGPHWGLRPGL